MSRLRSFCWLLACSCSSQQPVLFRTDAGTGPQGAGVGDACEETAECRDGLVCTDKACAPAGTTELCGGCILSDECQKGLGCTPNTGSCPTGCDGCSVVSSYGFCVPRGAAAKSEPCAADLECADGLYCELFGLGGACAPAGQGDLGDSCEVTGDCLAGLWCGLPEGDPPDSSCDSPLATFEPFTGVDCEDQDDEAIQGPFRVYFEVDTENDFYRMPFPNDALVDEDGKLDLSSHATPGILPPFGVDIVREYFDRITDEFSGFSPLGSIYLRFSREVDSDTLHDTETANPLRLIDVTPDNADFGQETSSFSWIRWSSNHAYICDNWLAWSPLRPLKHGHTYAALVTTDVLEAVEKDEEKADSVAQDADFAAMLDDAAPKESRLLRAWEAYAPLRAYLASTLKIASDQIAGATVFTVSNPMDIVARMAEVVRAGDDPVFSDVRLCEEAESEDTPCACGEPIDAYQEIHGTIELPIMQQGTRPYLTSDDGGGLELDSDGNPVIQDSEAVCFALSVPSDAISPLPVVIYAHGTGGDFQSGVVDIGETLAERGIATFGFTGVLHGERAGETTLSPDLLVFNFMNPEAARGNLLQGAADLFQIVRTLTTQSIDLGTSTVTFDPAKIYFFGHSQGSSTGGLAVPHEPGIAVAILSGAGGSLVETLSTKTSPYNIAQGVSFLLGESVSRYQPVLNLLQMYFDPVDLAQYGAAYFSSPPQDIPPRHVLMTYGLGDTYTPPASLGAFARALRVVPVGDLLEDYSGPEAISAPATQNYTSSNPDVTAVLVQVDPKGAYDGHFIAFEDDDLRERWASFLESAATTGVPTLP